jgi:hypothetical protein
MTPIGSQQMVTLMIDVMRSSVNKVRQPRDTVD